MIFSDKIYISKKFKEYRKKSGYTQEYVAEKIGISEKHYGKIERGIFSPSLDTFLKILDILNIPIQEFCINEIIDNNKMDLIKRVLLLDNKRLKLILKINDLFENLK